MISSPVTITATVPVTTPSTRRSSGVLGWHSAETLLVLGHVNGHLERARMCSLGFSTDETVLQWRTAYTLTGPFGQDPDTKRAICRHTPMSQVDLGPFIPIDTELAGKARLNGVGKIKKVRFEEGSRMGMPWNAVIVVSHDYSDPLKPLSTGRVGFDIIYHFGHYTPLPFQWEDFAIGATVLINASLIGKDTKTSSFIAQIEQCSIVGHCTHVV